MKEEPKKRKERMRHNFTVKGGRTRKRTMPQAAPESEPASAGPGKRSDERIASIAIDQILPDCYQGRLRWPVELAEIERLYSGEWTAQQFLDYVAALRKDEDNPALDATWQSIVDLAHSILSEGQVVPITVTPSRELPASYRFVIETGEGRYWAYQIMRWLINHQPEALEVEQEAWQEDPAYIRALAIAEPSRLRQVAENEQRQSYASAIDRAVAYASMLAEAVNYPVKGAPPGIRNGMLELPDAYWRAARRGLRGQKAVIQQVPTGQRQIQRHLKLLTDLDKVVLARAKQHGLSEGQLRSLVGKSPEEQRQLVEAIINQGLSSREVAAVRSLLEKEPVLSEEEATAKLREQQEAAKEAAKKPAKKEKKKATLPEEISRFLRSLTTAASRYESLRGETDDAQIISLLEEELRSYDDSASGARRAKTPRRRIQKLLVLLEQLDE
jgi:hypothetical protein